MGEQSTGFGLGWHRLPNQDQNGKQHEAEHREFDTRRPGFSAKLATARADFSGRIAGFAAAAIEFARRNGRDIDALKFLLAIPNGFHFAGKLLEPGFEFRLLAGNLGLDLLELFPLGQ